MKNLTTLLRPPFAAHISAVRPILSPASTSALLSRNNFTMSLFLPLAATINIVYFFLSKTVFAAPFSNSSYTTGHHSPLLLPRGYHRKGKTWSPPLWRSSLTDALNSSLRGRGWEYVCGSWPLSRPCSEIYPNSTWANGRCRWSRTCGWIVLNLVTERDQL